MANLRIVPIKFACGHIVDCPIYVNEWKDSQVDQVRDSSGNVMQGFDAKCDKCYEKERQSVAKEKA